MYPSMGSLNYGSIVGRVIGEKREICHFDSTSSHIIVIVEECCPGKTPTLTTNPAVFKPPESSAEMVQNVILCRVYVTKIKKSWLGSL